MVVAIPERIYINEIIAGTEKVYKCEFYITFPCHQKKDELCLVPQGMKCNALFDQKKKQNKINELYDCSFISWLQ